MKYGVTTKMLEIRNIKFSYQDYLDFDFNLKLSKGESLAVLGMTGSGKSTLLNLIAGFITPTEGEILFQNKNIEQITPHKRPVNMLFQENNIFNHLNVFNNVALGISPDLKINESEKLKIEKALEEVDLDGFNTRLPHQLSEGQKLRIAIARILVRKKPILLLDEPFLLLDPPVRGEMLGLVNILKKDNSLITLMVTRSYKEAVLNCDKICFINDGQIIHINDAKKFAESTNHPLINSYIESI
jgi:thiamine transport system ATP-binding protein